MAEYSKRICALTMVRNDEFFLRKWVEYYGRELGQDNIYVFFDGLDQSVPDFCDGVSIVKVPHIEGNVHQGDRGRIAFLNGKAAELFQRYDIVIGTDVDEFVIPDPEIGQTLHQFLSSSVSDRASLSPLGIDVGQNLKEEGALDPGKPFLSQRKYAKLSTRYSKCSILLKPVKWGSGFHRVSGRNFHIVHNLYLFHFGCADLGILKSKMSDSGLISSGWSKHLRKRAGTIRLVSSAKAHEWHYATSFARVIQNVFRPPYAWNKPSMFELKVVVRIPERFSNII